MIYIYSEREREKERDYIYIYIYILLVQFVCHDATTVDYILYSCCLFIIIFASSLVHSSFGSRENIEFNNEWHCIQKSF